MVPNKKFKKIGFIFGLKKEMKLISNKKENNFCVYGYGKASINATKKLLKHGVDIIINLGFAGSISKKFKNGDIVLIEKIYNEKKEKLSTFKFDRNLLRNLKKNFNFLKCDLLTVQKIVIGKKEKLNLLKKFDSASVIDMEAFHIKKELLRTEIPMISIKVIFDDLSFDIPFYIKDCIRYDGELEIIKFLIQIIKKPQRIIELYKLKLKFSRSRKILKEIINTIQTIE